MDEIRSLPLHRWLSACRLLMYRTPRWGADHAEIVLGRSPGGFRPGWNRRATADGSIYPAMYTYIGGEGETSFTTPVPPDVPPQAINEVPRELPELSRTRLWRMTLALADQVRAERVDAYPGDEVDRVMHSIEEASVYDGVTRSWDRMRQVVLVAKAAMEQAAVEALHDRVNPAEFLKPAIDIVRSYLSFGISGEVAGETLAVVLSVQCNLPRLGPPAMTPPPARKAAIEHLAAVTYRLLSRRAAMQVTPYYEMTYLASLYGDTCVGLAHHAEELGPSGGDEREQIDRIAMNVEEMAAHDVGPAFVPPAFHTPDELLPWLQQWTRIGTDIESFNLHPALAQLARSDPVPRQGTPRAIASAYQELAAGFEPDDVLASFDEAGFGEFSPIAEASLVGAAKGLLALAIAGKMRPQRP